MEGGGEDGKMRFGKQGVVEAVQRERKSTDRKVRLHLRSKDPCPEPNSIRSWKSQTGPWGGAVLREHIS